jgi:hypothetical protein
LCDVSVGTFYERCSYDDDEALSILERVKHAGDEALDQLEPLLEALRTMDALRENKRGVFYRRSKAFLHFHEDPTGLFVDVRCDGEFRRFAVGTKSQHNDVVARVRNELTN